MGQNGVDSVWVYGPWGWGATERMAGGLRVRGGGGTSRLTLLLYMMLVCGLCGTDATLHEGKSPGPESRQMTD